MGDKRFLDLPTELRTLVGFFEDDVRPSALLEVEQRTSSKATIQYQNFAFQRLELVGEPLERVIHALAQAQRDGEVSSQAGVDGRLWRCQSVDSRWMSLVCIDDWHQLHDLSLPGHQNGVKQCAPMPIEAEDFLDWTRFDVPGLSPWKQFLRNYDWASTGVGPMDTWNIRLRQCVVFINNHPHPRLLVWGDDMTFIYNEACIPLFGTKHPECFGKRASEPWAEIWKDMKPLIDTAYNGKTVTLERLPLTMERSESLEDTYWSFTLLPIMGPDGCGIGIMDELVDSTKLVRGERRRTSMLQINEHITSASTLEGLWTNVLTGLERLAEEVPFAMFYTVEDHVPDTPTEGSECSANGAAHKECVLQGTVGIAADSTDAIKSFCLMEHLEIGPGVVKPCLQAWKTQKTVVLSSKDGSLPASLTIANARRGFGDRVHTALVTPITSVGRHECLGILVMGLNPRSPFDDEYNLWTRLMTDLLERSASLILLPEEQRRAQKISDDMNDALAQQLQTTTQQAERSEARFSRMASSAPTGMYMFDGTGKTLHVNDAYLAMLGVTREEHDVHRATATPLNHLIHSDDLERFRAAWHSVLELKSPVNIEYRLKRPWTSVDRATGHKISGETWLLANAFPEIDPEGKVATVQGWLTDISHRKFSENLLTQRLEDALETKRQTESFIDMTSHEMRNPLSAILQSADSIVSLLDQTGLPILKEALSVSHDVAEEIVDAAQTIILCAGHQKRIVDDILTLSKLDASLLVISPDKVQPPQLVKKALKMYESEISRAGIEAKLCVESSYNELNVDWVVLDSSRLLQVIINLLTNAIKFTRHSEPRNITICLGASSDRPSGNHHKVDYIPVRQARQDQLTGDDWGKGDTLYLQVAVSDTGQGLREDETKVLFQRFSQASPKTYKQYGGSGLGLWISRELCELQGGQIGVSSSAGRTTFTFFVAAKHWVPDVSETPLRPSIPKFTSASASPMVYSRRGSFAPEEATSQPRERQTRSTAISEEPDSMARLTVPNDIRKPSATTKEVDGNADEKLHVLIVEDNLINQKVMSKQLQKVGCIVHVANHGVECLRFLEQSSFCAADTPLSVILLDLEMPTMDGLTCIRHIREQQLSGKISGHVPVIAVTANARSEQISTAIDCGMDRVVTKPFRIPELVPQMKSLVAELASRSLI